jgi:uncharacterized protein with NAD-binding domain and iron-sulfur cluster
MPDSAEEPPLFSNADFPRVQTRRARREAVKWLNKYIGELWPDATFKGSKRFRWDLLAAPDAPAPPQTKQLRKRLRAQYFRANVEPSERYVLSLPGTGKYRLRSNFSGFDNLYLAGDWTKTSVNGGCVEAAVISGMQASRGICGYPKSIPSESNV